MDNFLKSVGKHKKVPRFKWGTLAVGDNYLVDLCEDLPRGSSLPLTISS